MRPCKFGANCNKYPMGTCTFSHDGQNKGGYSPKPNTGNPNMGGYNPNMGNPFNPNQPKMNKTGPPKTMDEFQNMFCREYQLSNTCKYMEKCQRKHQFTLDNRIKRQYFNRGIPVDIPCKITKFTYQGKDIFTLRNNNKLTFFTYDSSNVAINEVGGWEMPQQDTEYHLYTQKKQYIYMAWENPKSGFAQFAIYDLPTQKTFVIADAHAKKITDAVHISPEVMITTSLDGVLKTWKLAGDTYVYDQATSDHFRKQYVKESKPELNFVDYQILNGVTILSVGTSDGRLLLFTGNQMVCAPIVFQFMKVFAVRFIKFAQNSIIALALVWNAESTQSAVIAVDLNNFSQESILEIQAEQNSRLNYSILQTYEDLIFVGNSYGLISIYKVPFFKKKAGLMMHQNNVTDICFSESITNNGIKISTLLVLENKHNMKEGSLGIYMLVPN